MVPLNNSTLNSGLNADKLDGYDESSFLRYRGSISTDFIDLTSTSSNAIGYQNPLTGIYSFSRTGHSESLISFTSTGSASGLDILFCYSTGSEFQIRRRIDSNRISGPWEKIFTDANYTSWVYAKSDVYTKTESDNRFVNVTGDTMTGILKLNSSPSQSTPPLQINYNNSFTTSDHSIGLIKFGHPTNHDAYLGIAPSTKTYFGKDGYFFHIATNGEFDWMSSSWTKLMALEASTGNLWVSGSVTASNGFVGNLTGTASYASNSDKLDGFHSYNILHSWSSGAGGTNSYKGWIKIGKWNMNSNNYLDCKSFTLYITRGYYCNPSESYIINFTVGWNEVTIQQINANVSSQIISKIRIAKDTTNHIAYLEYYVDPNVTASSSYNGVECKLFGINSRYGGDIITMSEKDDNPDSLSVLTELALSTSGAKLVGDITNSDTVDGKHYNYFGFNRTSDNYDLNEVGTHFAAYRFSNAPANAFSSAAYGNALVIGADSDTMTQIGGPYSSQELYFRNGTWYSNGTGTIRTQAWNRILHSGNYTSFVDNYYWANVKISTTANYIATPSTRYVYFRNSDNTDYAGYVGRGSGDNTIYFCGYSTNNLIINAGGQSNQIYLKSNGNIGLGTNSPSSRLYVSGDEEVSDRLFAYKGLWLAGNSDSYTDSTGRSRPWHGFSGNYSSTDNDEKTVLCSYEGLTLKTNSGSYYFKNGRLGILNNSPNYTLDISGNMHNTGQYYAELENKNLSSVNAGNSKIYFGWTSNDKKSTRYYNPWIGGIDSVNSYGYGNTISIGAYHSEMSDCGLYIGASWDGAVHDTFFTFSRSGYLTVPSQVISGGFVHSGINNNGYVLTAGGSYKEESSLSVSYAASAGNSDTTDGYHLEFTTLSPMASSSSPYTYYWYKIARPSAWAVYEIICGGDKNYPYHGRYTLTMSSYYSYSHSFCLLNHGRYKSSDSTLYITADNDYVYIQGCLNWECWIKIRCISGTNRLTTSSVGSATAGTVSGFTPTVPIYSSAATCKVDRQNNTYGYSGVPYIKANLEGDADTLDGYHAASFSLTSHNHDDRYLKLTGGTLSDNNFYLLNLNGGNQGGTGIQLTHTATNAGLGILLYKQNDWGMAMLNYSASKAIGILDNGNPYFGWGSSKYTLWHSGNDGSGSGLDADLLDGHDTSYFATSNHTHGLSHSDFFHTIPSDGGNMTWKAAFGYNPYNNLLMSVRYNTPTTWTADSYGSGILFGGSDTKGFMSTSFGSPKIVWAGGNGTSDSATPNWYMGISGTSGVTYNLANFSVNGHSHSNLSFTNTSGSTVTYNGTSAVDLTGGLYYSVYSTVTDKVKVISGSGWNTIKSSTDPLRVYFYDSYNDGGPTTYGDVLDIVGISGHWEPQLFFGGWTSGHVYFRNKDYAGSSFGSWKTLIDSELIGSQSVNYANYAGYVSNSISFKNTAGSTVSFNGSSTLDLTGGIYYATYSAYSYDSDKLDGYDNTSFFRYRDSISANYVDLTSTSSWATNYQNPYNGIYSVSRSGYSGSLIAFTGSGSSSGLDIYFEYSRASALKIRRRIDSNRISGDWEHILTSANWSSYISTSSVTVSNSNPGLGKSSATIATVGGTVITAYVNDSDKVDGLHFWTGSSLPSSPSSDTIYIIV